MPYAEGRTFLDADSHIMELPDFLRDHADPAIRDRVPRLTLSGGGKIRDALDKMGERRAHTPDTVDELLALGDGLIAGPKGYEALGAFNPDERSQALDLLGFDSQLVFATFSAGEVFHRVDDPEVAEASMAAHNRGMAAFCSDDPRLLGVGAACLDDPESAIRALQQVIDLELAAVWVPHRPAGGRSPGHNDLDRFWAMAADAGLPIVLHVGGHPLQLDPAWMNTGREVPTDWLGGGENVRGKDMISLHHQTETFVGTLVLDGVLERHRNLQVGVVELGAGWVPSMLRRLDSIAEIWKRSEPELAALTRKPSEQVTEQMSFTPYPFEAVDTIVNESAPELYLFSSDYPHAEGGRDPIGRFDRTTESLGDAARDLFFAENFRTLYRV